MSLVKPSGVILHSPFVLKITTKTSTAKHTHHLLSLLSSQRRKQKQRVTGWTLTIILRNPYYCPRPNWILRMSVSLSPSTKQWQKHQRRSTSPAEPAKLLLVLQTQNAKTVSHLLNPRFWIFSEVFWGWASISRGTFKQQAFCVTGWNPARTIIILQDALGQKFKIAQMRTNLQQNNMNVTADSSGLKTRNYKTKFNKLNHYVTG